MSVDQLMIDPRLSAGPRTSVLRRLLRDPQAVITASILAVLLVLAVLAPLIQPYDPNAADLQSVNLPPGSAGHVLGTDQSGRDILSRLLASLGTSASSGGIGAGVALVLGTVAGLAGGYLGPRVRAAIEWLFNLLMTFPGLLILVLLLPVTGGDHRITMLIFGVLMSPTIFRIVRNLVLGVRNELYIDAARVAGLSNVRILRRHVLFVIRGPIIIAVAFLTGSAIGTQSGLAFLGLGSNMVPSFGAMVADGFTNLYRVPTQVVWPALTLGIITSCLVLLGNALRDVLEGAQPKPAKRIRGGEVEAQPRPSDPDVLLDVRDLAITYPGADGERREAVSDVSFTVKPGQVLGLVGESGSGKTQTMFAVMGALPTEALVSRGSVGFAGRELLGLPERELRKLRGSEIAYIPQEPMSNLDPSYTVGAQLVEGIRAVARMTRSQAREHALGLLERVGINDPQRTFESYPHQISGGMAQRVLIAGAVAGRPKLLIADEPTTALDVTVQAEVLDLIRDLQQELGMAVVLVTHNFGVVADLCDSIAVMRHGRIVETGTTREVFQSPSHPYTRMLLDSILDDATVRKPLPERHELTEGMTR